MAENEKEQLKKFIHQLPNAVNGDGKAFVAQLKKALSYLSEHAGGSGGGEDSGEGEDAINQVTALRLTEVHTVDSSGFPKNNIEVTFDNSNIDNYAFAQIWVKDDTENTYQQHGNTNGTRYLFENALVGRTYTVKVVVQLKDGRTSNFDNAPTASILIQGSVLIPDAPTQFFLTWDEDGALWQWQYKENEYIDFFELRLDANAGVYNDKLLDKTRLSYSRVSPGVRSGTAYLFIRNVFGDYSTPATHIFNKPVGVKPNKPVLQATLDGVVITMSPLPTGYQGYVLEIDGEEFKTINRQFVYYKFSGTVKARYCYYDEIGRGEWSEYESITIKVVLDPDELPEITYDAFDQTIKDAIDGANAQKDINSQIMADITLVQKDVANISKDIAGIESDISGVTAEINATEKELQANIDATQENINEVIAELNKNASDSPYLSIQQTQDSIKTIVGEVDRVEGKTNSNFTLIQQNTNSISSLASRVTDEVSGLDEKITTNASQISQTADEIRSLVYEREEVLDGKINTNATAIATNATQITQTAERVESVASSVTSTKTELEAKIATNTSKIEQTADSIETVVTQKVTVAKGEIKGEILDEIGGDIKEEVTKEVGSQIKQEADNITATVYEQVKGEIASEVASQVKIEADEIKSTVYTKTEVDDSLANKANKSDVYTKEETASQIRQTAEEVKVLVYKDIDTLENKVDGNTADIKTNASSIAINTQGITALSTSISEVSGKVNTQASEIKVLNDQIVLVATKQELNTVSNKVDQNTASIGLANDSITSVVSKLNGAAQDSGYEALTGLASSIKQTSDSITSVVTELNKDAEDCSYSAITQLKDGIDLSVKKEDFTGKEIISRINLTPEVITIDGKYVHVTGDTVFDEDVIVGGYIKADTINTDHLQTNAVTTAKIASNAITADKIEADAITNEKITDKSISSVKIEDGAITVTKIADGAVGSTKIEGGAITTEHIQAGSIIGEHVSAGAISADKLYAGNIDMTGALALVGGAVRLDEKGLTCAMNNGTSTVFDSLGITYYSKSGIPFGQIRQMCMGVAEHGSRVSFSAPWDSTPTVVCMPTSIQLGTKQYSQSDVFLNCKAMNITNEGFNVQCYTSLGAGATNFVPLNINFSAPTELGGVKVTEYELNGYQSSATKFSLSMGVTTYSGWTVSAVGDSDEWTQASATCKISVYNDGVLVSETEELQIPNYPSQSTSFNSLYVPVTIDGEVESVGVLTIKVTSIYRGDAVAERVPGVGLVSKPAVKEIPVTIYSLSYTHEAVSSNTILIDAEFDAPTVYVYRVEGTQDTDYELDGYQAPATKFTLRLTATTYNGWDFESADDSNNYYTPAYATCLISVYNDGVLVGQSEKLPLPSRPVTQGDNVMNTLNNSVIIEGEVESIGILTVRVTTYYSGNYNIVGNDRVPMNIKKIPVAINSLSYETDKEVVISTGTALFIAMTGVNSAYSVSK